MYSKFIYFITILFLVTSCSSKKKILYLQDHDSFLTDSFDYKEYKLKVDDILKIDISSEVPEAAIPLNRFAMNGNFSLNKETLSFYGFQVDSNGDINYPSLGLINVVGLTINEFRDKLYNKITEIGILTNPNIDIKLLNANVTVLGEVNKPGTYSYNKNNMNFFEAIGLAGDLTINGKRDDIKLIREQNGKKNIYSINLNRTGSLTQETYQIISGDIIIVNPNTTRVKNAGIIGNSGTLLSLLSFILSSIIVINN